MMNRFEIINKIIEVVKVEFYPSFIRPFNKSLGEMSNSYWMRNKISHDKFGGTIPSSSMDRLLVLIFSLFAISFLVKQCFSLKNFMLLHIFNSCIFDFPWYFPFFLLFSSHMNYNDNIIVQLWTKIKCFQFICDIIYLLHKKMISKFKKWR